MAISRPLLNSLHSDEKCIPTRSTLFHAICDLFFLITLSLQRRNNVDHHLKLLLTQRRTGRGIVATRPSLTLSNQKSCISNLKTIILWKHLTAPQKIRSRLCLLRPSLQKTPTSLNPRVSIHAAHSTVAWILVHRLQVLTHCVPVPVTLLDMGSTESPKSNSCKAPPRDIPTSESFQDLEDKDGWTMGSIRVLLIKHMKEIDENREYFTKVRANLPHCFSISNTMQFRLGRARRIHDFPEPDTTAESSNDFISGPSIVPAKFAQQEFPWPNATAIQTRGAVKTGESKPRNQKTQEVFSHGNNKGIRSIISNPVDFYAVNTVPVPPYTNYVSLKQNVLAENHRTLMVYPYFDDDQDEDLAKKSLWDELQSRYNIVADELRRRRILQAEQAWQLRSYAEKIIEELPMEMQDILAYFLLPSEALIRNLQIEMSLEHAHCLEQKRPPSCMEEFNREKKKWRAVYENLPPTTVRGLAIAAILCPIWLETLKFSFWHIARRSSLAQPPPPGNRPQLGGTNGSSDFAYRTLACRVCHLHNCPFHGAILEQPEPSDHSESEDSDTAHDSSDDDERSPSDSRPNSLRRLSISSEASLVNFKKHVKAQPREHPADDGIIVRRNTSQWLKTRTHIMEKRPPFFPCSHKGTCSEAKCSCFRANIVCEKTCACAASCKRRYRGCTCAQYGLACFKNNKCECWALNRECDPDLCASCGAAEVLDPINRYNDALYRQKCGNVNIQRNVPKRTLLGQSEVQGFGLYAGERLKAGEYIGEYKGEIVTKEEGSRRGAVYQHLKTNYLFDLNKGKYPSCPSSGTFTNSLLQPKRSTVRERATSSASSTTRRRRPTASLE